MGQARSFERGSLFSDLSSLGLHLEGEAHLVAGLVELVAINGGGEGQRDAVTQLLLVAQANLEYIGESTFVRLCWQK